MTSSETCNYMYTYISIYAGKVELTRNASEGKLRKIDENKITNDLRSILGHIIHGNINLFRITCNFRSDTVHNSNATSTVLLDFNMFFAFLLSNMHTVARWPKIQTTKLYCGIFINSDAILATIRLTVYNVLENACVMRRTEPASHTIHISYAYRDTFGSDVGVSNRLHLCVGRRYSIQYYTYASMARHKRKLSVLTLGPCLCACTALIGRNTNSTIFKLI